MSARIFSFDNLSSIVDNDPTSYLFARYASMLFKKGDVDSAVKVAEEGVMAHPSYVAGRIVLAECYLASGKLDGAIMQLVESIKMEPDNARAIRLLAQSYDQQGLSDKTEKLYTLLNHREPNSPFLKKRTISPILVPIYAILGLEMAERAESSGSSVSSTSADSDGWGSSDSNDEATITVDTPRSSSGELDSLMGDLGLGVQSTDMNPSVLDDVMAGLEEDLHVENEYGTSEIDTIVGELDNFETLLPGEDQATIIESLDEFTDSAYAADSDVESTLVADNLTAENELLALDEEVSVLDEDASVLDEDASVLDEDASVLDEDASVLDEDASVLDEDASVLDEDASVLDEDASVLDEDASVLDEDASVLDEDASVLDEDASVLDEDASVLDEEELSSAVAELTLGVNGLSEIDDEFSVMTDENADRSDEFTIDSDLLSDSISSTYDNPVYSDPELLEPAPTSLESLMDSLDIAPEVLTPILESSAESNGTGYSPVTALIEEDLEVTRDEVMETFAELTAGFAEFVSADVEPSIAELDPTLYSPATELVDDDIAVTHDEAFETFAELAAGFEEFVSADSANNFINDEPSVTTEENQFELTTPGDKSVIPELFIEPEVSLASMASAEPNRTEMPKLFANDGDEPDFSHETLHTDEIDISVIHAVLAEEALVPPSFGVDSSRADISEPVVSDLSEDIGFDSVATNLAEGIETLFGEQGELVPEFGALEELDLSEEEEFDTAIHFDSNALEPLHEHVESALDSHIPETITTANGTSEFDVEQVLQYTELDGDDLNEFMVSSDGDTEATLVGFDFPEAIPEAKESAFDAGTATSDFSMAELQQILGTASVDNQEMSEEDEDLLFNSHHDVADTAEFSIESLLNESLLAKETEIPALPTVDTTRSFEMESIVEEEELLEEEFAIESNPLVEVTSHESDNHFEELAEFSIESNPLVEVTSHESEAFLDSDEEVFSIESNPLVEVTSHESGQLPELSEEEFVIEDTFCFDEQTVVDNPADLFNDMPLLDPIVETRPTGAVVEPEWVDDTFDSEPEEKENHRFVVQVDLPDHVLTPTFADIYLQQDQPIIAKQIYERLLERDPENDLYLERIEEIDTYISLHPESLEQLMTDEEIHETHRTLEGKRLDSKHRSKLIEHRRKKGSHE